MRDSLDRCQAGLAVVVGNSVGDPLPWVTGWVVGCVGNGRTLRIRLIELSISVGLNAGVNPVFKFAPHVVIQR